MTSSSDQTSDPHDSSSRGDGVLEPPLPHEGEEVSLMDALLVVVRNKRVIFRTVLVFVVLGLTYSLLSSDEYTASADVIRETESEVPNIGGGLSALQGLGINLGAVSGGLNPEAFPQILRSREVRLAIATDTFSFPGEDGPSTLLSHVDQPPGTVETIIEYTLKLPGKIADAVKGEAGDEGRSGAPPIPTEEEEEVLQVLEEMISTSVDDDTGIMTMRVTTEDPQLSAQIAQSVITHLTQRVRSIRTEKVQQRLEFVEKRFGEVEDELESAEDRLAKFLERNQNPTTARLRFQRDRLQRQVRFKEQLYGELQSQLTQVRLEYQRKQPVVTVVENPVPPLKPTGPSGIVILVVTSILGLVVGTVLAFLKALLANAAQEKEESAKIQELKESIDPRYWWQRKEV
jgi:uncharacterized protein involved in exopolysaccharide biosynthesis